MAKIMHDSILRHSTLACAVLASLSFYACGSGDDSSIADGGGIQDATTREANAAETGGYEGSAHDATLDVEGADVPVDRVVAPLDAPAEAVDEASGGDASTDVDGAVDGAQAVDAPPDGTVDAGADGAVDAAIDTEGGAVVDAEVDAAIDAVPDVSRDAAADGGTGDAGGDAPLDAGTVVLQITGGPITCPTVSGDLTPAQCSLAALTNVGTRGTGGLVFNATSPFNLGNNLNFCAPGTNLGPGQSCTLRVFIGAINTGQAVVLATKGVYNRVLTIAGVNGGSASTPISGTVTCSGVDTLRGSVPGQCIAASDCCTDVQSIVSCIATDSGSRICN